MNNAFKIAESIRYCDDKHEYVLGQEKDLNSQVLFTVSDAVASNAKKMGYDMVAKIGLNNG